MTGGGVKPVVDTTGGVQKIFGHASVSAATVVSLAGVGALSVPVLGGKLSSGQPVPMNRGVDIAQAPIGLLPDR